MWWWEPTVQSVIFPCSVLSSIHFDSEQPFDGDKAYVGGKNITTPQKKPRNSQLTANQKAENKVKARQRIFVEHVIRLLKIFRVASERFRLRPDIYEQVILTVCGLAFVANQFPIFASSSIVVIRR